MRWKYFYFVKKWKGLVAKNFEQISLKGTVHSTFLTICTYSIH